MPTKNSPEKATGPRFDSPEQEVYLNLWRTYDRLRMLEDALFETFDLTCQQYNVLRLLKGAAPEPLPTLAIASRLVSRSPDITRMLDKLERKKLISRERPDSNRRQVLIAITKQGIEQLKIISEPLHACHKKQLGHLSARRRSELCDLLKEARRPHEEAGSDWQ